MNQQQEYGKKKRSEYMNVRKEKICTEHTHTYKSSLRTEIQKKNTFYTVVYNNDDDDNCVEKKTDSKTNGTRTKKNTHTHKTRK